MTRRLLWLSAFLAAAWIGACGAPPGPRPGAEAARAAPPARPSAPDDCAETPGKPAPEPLARQYSGVAKKARCQREIFTIMGGLTHFLGVSCSYCHVEPNYEIMTHNKRVANWMASELIPRLEKKRGGEVWCNDCHLQSGKGVTKILRDPRSESWAIEWMTTHLVENFEGEAGARLRCKTCHKGNLGSPEFQKKIILTDGLPPRLRGATSPEPLAPVPLDAGTPEPAAGDAGVAEPEPIQAP